MSFAGKRYSNYSAFVTHISPGEDYWDRNIHAHTTEELLLLTEEGICTVTCNGNTYQVPTPAFIWTRPGAYHLVSGFSAKTKRSFMISFIPRLLEDIPPAWRYYDFIQDCAMFAMSLSNARLFRLERLFTALLESPMPQRAPLLTCIFHQASLYLKAGMETVCAPNSFSYIFKVIAILEKQNNKDLTTALLAEQFHVSKSKLERDFKNCTGHTIHAFRLQVQLQAARLQLTTTDKSLTQIATDCGFTDRSHLIRCFRTEYGMTPGQCRKNYQNRPR